MTPKEAMQIVLGIANQKALIARGVKDPAQKALLEKQVEALLIVNKVAMRGAKK